MKELCDQGLITHAASDYSGNVLWSDARYGGDLDLITGLNVSYHLDTHGIFLSEATITKLFSSRVTSINVSLDAGKDETYRKIRKGAPPLHVVVERMRLLSNRRDVVSRRDCKLTTSMTLMRSNIEEIADLLRLAKDVGFDAVITRHLEVYEERLKEESLWFHHELFNTRREMAIFLAKESNSTCLRRSNVVLRAWAVSVVLSLGDRLW